MWLIIKLSRRRKSFIRCAIQRFCGSGGKFQNVAKSRTGWGDVKGRYLWLQVITFNQSSAVRLLVAIALKVFRALRTTFRSEVVDQHSFFTWSFVIEVAQKHALGWHNCWDASSCRGQRILADLSKSQRKLWTTDCFGTYLLPFDFFRFSVRWIQLKGALQY